MGMTQKLLAYPSLFQRSVAWDRDGVIVTHMQADVGEVSTASVACGVLGVGGNKGGVAVSFTLYRRRLCCVSSHFAAHQVLLVTTCCTLLTNRPVHRYQYTGMVDTLCV